MARVVTDPQLAAVLLDVERGKAFPFGRAMNREAGFVWRQKLRAARYAGELSAATFAVLGELLSYVQPPAGEGVLPRRGETPDEFRFRRSLEVFARIEMRDVESSWWASCHALEALLTVEARKPGTLGAKLPDELFQRLVASGVLQTPLTQNGLRAVRLSRIAAQEAEHAEAKEAAE